MYIEVEQLVFAENGDFGVCGKASRLRPKVPGS